MQLYVMASCQENGGQMFKTLFLQYCLVPLEEQKLHTAILSKFGQLNKF